MRQMDAMKLTLLFMTSMVASSWAVPNRHSRRSASANGIGSQPEIVVSNPLREEAEVSEEEHGSHCLNYSDKYMSLFKLTGRDGAVCNDQSQAGYYLLRKPNSKKWLIYLEGGWYCSDESTCKMRAIKEPRLVTSSNWHPCKLGDGIFSASQTENPYLYNSNIVFMPYCSSDVWSGTVRNQLLGDIRFSFMGSIIIEQVVKLLIRNHGMREASSVLLAGSSAGGTGVFMNVDLVKSYLNTEGVSANVRGVVDSGWYLKRPSMDNDVRCRLPNRCSPVAMIKMGVSLWQPNIPPRCVAAQSRTVNVSPNSARRSFRSRDNRWTCFFGPVVNPYIEAEIFIVQWLFDPVQLKSDNINLFSFQESNAQLLTYIQDLYSGMNNSFSKIKGVFATSCFSHMTLDRSDWQSFTVSRVSLPDAIQCWEINLDSTVERRHAPEISNSADSESRTYVTSQRRHHHNRAAIYNDRNDGNDEFATTEMVPDDDDEYIEGYYQNNYFPEELTESHNLEPTRCIQRAIDPCPLPQCNPTCPQLYNSQTHAQINAIDFLQGLGIDLRSIASRAGSNAAQLLRDLSRG